MSNKKPYPRSELVKTVDINEFEQKLKSTPDSERMPANQPASKPKEDVPIQDETDSISISKEQTELSSKTSQLLSQNTKAAPDSVGKKEKVMTYFPNGTYAQFMKFSEEIRREIYERTGTKLKETNIAAFAILLTVDKYQQDQAEIIEKFIEKL